MDKSDNAEVCRAEVLRAHRRARLPKTLIRFVDGSCVDVSGDVTKRFPHMSGNVGFLQLHDIDDVRIVVNLDSVTYMRVIGEKVANDDEG